MRIKTNRLSKKPIIALLFVGVFLFIGGAFAFNTDSFSFNNLFHLGTHVATHTEEFVSPSNWHTCEEIPKTLTTRNDSTHDIYVRLSYDEYWRMQNDLTNLPLTKDGIRLAVINFQNEDDWELRDDGWYYFKESLKPGDSTTSLFKSVTLDCSASFGGDNICRETETGTVCEKPEDRYENAKYHLKITVQTTDEDDGLPEDELCHVTVNPNGGTFRESSELFSKNIRCGTNFDLTSISYDDHEFRDWTLNEQETYTDDNIYVDSDVTLTANWLSVIKYNVTVDPNGGSYAGSTTPTSYAVRKDSQFTLGEATREGYFVDYWQVVDGERLASTSFIVTGDITVQPHWEKIVARIERTGKYYNSIMSAESAAIANDTITLLVDTEETVTNSKKVTLDLNNHTVIGSLTNTSTGNITLINGEINNPAGSAVTNDGILTMGINDYNDDGSANIINDNIRLIGTTAGLMQTNDTYQFYFYDGYLEGSLGLVGGYDGAPFYRRTFDDLMIYYFPFVEHLESGDRDYQHVELKNADRAVTKTSVHGDIYYYNFQDNINVSNVTGYTIYAVRDFDASYPITITNGNTISFDISGYTITAADTWTIEGTLNISDSKPEGEDGIIEYAQTIINNGSLNLTNAKLTTINANALLRNNKNLSLTNSTLASNSTGSALEIVVNGTTLVMDDNSYITGSSKYSLYYSATDLVINGGNITSNTSANAPIYLEKNAELNIKGGNIITNNTTASGTAIAIKGANSSSILTIDGGAISSLNSASSYTCSTISNGGTVTINGGTIKASCNGTAAAIETNATTTINAGNIIAESSKNIARAISGSSKLIVNGGIITATVLAENSSSYAYGISSSGGLKQINGGTIIANSTRGNAYGISQSGNIEITDGIIKATSTSAASYGVYESYRGSTVTINNGNIEATSDTGTGYGVYISNYSINTSIAAGKISGSTYGVRGYSDSTTTIGNDDGEISITSPEIIGGSYALYDGSVNFYDGILKGGVNAYQDGVIVGIPDGATYHIETIDDVENCWLVQDENYLEVNGVQYNSLIKAFAAANDGDTVKAIASISTESKMPTNPSGKTIIFDLNGQHLNYTQTIVNEGTLIVMDSSADQSGILSNSANYTISNTNANGTIQLLSGTITNSAADTIQVERGTIQIDGGKVSNTTTNRRAIYGTNFAQSTINITGGIVEAPANAIEGYSSSYTRVNLTGGKVIAKIQGIARGNVTINGGEVIVNNTANNNQAVGIANSTTNLISGKITVTTAGTGSVVGFNYGTTTVSGGEVTVTTPSTGNAYGIYASDASNTMTGGKITVSSVGGIAYGVLSGSSSTTYNKAGLTMTNGEITAQSETKESYGVHGGSHNISGGKITAGTYGVRTYRATTIGNDDGEISITSPEIIGGSYALYDGSVNFYDGILKGGVNAYQDGVIKTIAPQSTVYLSQEQIEDDSYEVVYLIDEYNVAKIGDTKFKNLAEAVAAANNGDLIELIADNYIFYTLEIPSGKTVTIDIHDYNVISSHQIVNSGNLTLKSSSDNPKTINYPVSGYFIENQAEGILTLDNIRLSSPFSLVRSTGANLTITNSVISTTSVDDSVIRSTSGNLTVSNSNISGGSYGIYLANNINQITNTTMTNGYSTSRSTLYSIYAYSSESTTATGLSTNTTSIYNDTGEFTLADSTIIESSQRPSYELITNVNGTFNINNSQISKVRTVSGASSANSAVITNKGTMSITNGSVITAARNNSANTGFTELYLLDNYGTVTTSDSNFTSSFSAQSTSSTTIGINNRASAVLDFLSGDINISYGATVYGIRDSGGNTTIHSGTIKALGYPSQYGNASVAYGAYITSGGELTLGEAEPSSSSDYGQATANVSTTTPEITGIGVKTGAAIKNSSSRFNYYDGKLIGSTVALPETPTKIEYLYEVGTYTDEETGYEYAILEYMR